MKKELSLHQKKVLVAFHPINKDVEITRVYREVYTRIPAGIGVREMQQKLAPTFAAINKKLDNGKIEPGELKRTYRLTVQRV